MRTVIRLAVFLSILPSTSLRAQDLSSSGGKQSLEKAVVRTIDFGAILYNEGDATGCYRFYQGALIALGPVLDSSPDLQRKVNVHIRQSEAARTAEDRAFALRRALDVVLTSARTHAATSAPPAAETRPSAESRPALPTRGGAMPEPPPLVAARPEKTLWDRLGGGPVVADFVKDLLTRSLADPKVNFTRGGKYPLDEVGRKNLEQLFVHYISQASGGPDKYAGRSMTESHKGMGITDDQFNAMMTHLVSALKDRKLPQADVDELVNLMNSTRRDVAEVKTTEAAPPAGSAVTSPPPGQTLWTRLGGEPVVARIVHDLIERASKNPNVDFTRGGKYKLDEENRAKLERKFIEYISTRIGGPLKYPGREMKASHQGMGITEDQFDSMNGDLVLVMKTMKLDQELIDELISVLATTFDAIVEKK